MKRTLIAAILAATAGTVGAQSFQFQQQFGSEEYVAGHDAAGMTFAPVETSNRIASLTRWMLDANVDGIAPNAHDGIIIETGPTRISLYEFVRDSPEGIAYADYHDRYPAGTDWDRVAQVFREHNNGAVAVESGITGSDS
ncbi:MAG: hypothetical protein KDI88_10000 [Gammaproteobacteria bacterium]|nr:hypothetical protein [Gammaproteobacteria bacterium]